MGLSSLPLISSNLIENGAAEDTPVAVIADGTRAGQKVVTAKLSTIADRVEEENLQSPAMIIVGSVVTLRDTLSWFH